MSIFSLIGNYFLWHYSMAFVGIFRVWSNFFRFLYHFFSISTLMHTLFSPWKKIHEVRESAGFSFQDILSVIIINTVMRLIGFLFRIFLIAIWIMLVLSTLLAGVFVLITWVLSPLLVIVFFISGIIFLFK